MMVEQRAAAQTSAKHECRCARMSAANVGASIQYGVEKRLPMGKCYPTNKKGNDIKKTLSFGSLIFL